MKKLPQLLSLGDFLFLFSVSTSAGHAADGHEEPVPQI